MTGMEKKKNINAEKEDYKRIALRCRGENWQYVSLENLLMFWRTFSSFSNGNKLSQVQSHAEIMLNKADTQDIKL